MAGRPIKALPQVPEGLLSPQQASIYRLVRAGRTVREAADELGIPAKQASRQLAAIRKKAESLPDDGVTPGARGTPAPRTAWREEALALIEDRGLSPIEAARRLEVSPGAVRSLLWRHRRRTGAGRRMVSYRLGDDGYLPAATQPGTGFGLRLANCRRRAGLTREQLAEMGGMTVAALERLEKGEYLPRWPLADKLCRALGVELADLAVPCGRVELARELVLQPGGATEDRPRRVRSVRRLAAVGASLVVLRGPAGDMVMHGKGRRFVLHLDRTSRGTARRVLEERRLRLLELTGDGGAFYLSTAADVLALREEGGWSEN